MFDKLNDINVNPRGYSPLALAYIGDAVYEIVVRDYIIKKANAPVNQLHKATKQYVKASGQAKMYHKIKDILTAEELAVLKRGRNAKSASSPKNGDIREYRLATGVEALVGFLYLNNEIERLANIMEIGIAEIEREI
ncbi:Mini-ribonuclease 3 [Candidatus Epulonipiscium viviparus]|uniref:Mini-ribonuclease 3 n=1 Tax=Candidatus Epulonipiscium viviparus TaxID=420336 RepID=UPI0027380C4C|nr:ribonuclease III domain-containing protein [Candidatus Epulopiscium viviparus]